MSIRLEEQIRRYTETMDAQAVPLEELIPSVFVSDFDFESAPAVEITIPLGPSRLRRGTPGWVYGLAAAVVVFLASIPVWVLVSNPDQSVVDTTPTPTTMSVSTPTTTAKAPPTTVVAPVPTGDNPHLGLDNPEGNVSGHELAPGVVVMMRVNGNAWSEIGITDESGSFDVHQVANLEPGNLLEIEAGGIVRTLTLPDLTFDIYDPETGIASGTTSLSDGTILSLHVSPTTDPSWETYFVEVVDGEWTYDIPVDFATGWPNANITYIPDGAVYAMFFVP